MSQTKKGKRWHFGMKAQIGIDAESALIHAVECTIAKVVDNVMLKDSLHGDEQIAFADRGYHQNNCTIEHLQTLGGLAILVPAIRAVVQHPFRVIKQRFGFTRVCYRGLTKNAGQIAARFTLSHPGMAPRLLTPALGEGACVAINDGYLSLASFMQQCYEKPIVT